MLTYQASTSWAYGDVSSELKIESPCIGAIKAQVPYLARFRVCTGVNASKDLSVSWGNGWLYRVAHIADVPFEYKVRINSS